ncbi:helix-turn-helix domain-containing protein [Gordonia sihwensis]|uniref:HTH cro/C1-type domain-containing protein n=1 Tax=Gordonia sihwensis NBRC 108236 TaxID=1223544 RepID=L7LMK8_9ACTN|nr:helix-turn-helix transcriptional regulator [Gordonia sihwensis]GAC62375.1 hypothetical protein GSI01S_33_00610 [Gordonia sihwensis NBRC 108236]
MLRDLGATSWAVAYHLRAVRTERGISLRGLSSLMKEVEYPMSHATLSEIERGDRRVTVDDLTALAAALGIAPIAFLLPVPRDGDADPNETARLTGTPEVPLRQLTDWVRGESPLKDEDDSYAVETFRRASLPRWLWKG